MDIATFRASQSLLLQVCVLKAFARALRAGDYVSIPSSSGLRSESYIVIFLSETVSLVTGWTNSALMSMLTSVKRAVHV